MKLERAYSNPLEFVIGFLQQAADAFWGWIGWLFELITDVLGA